MNELKQSAVDVTAINFGQAIQYGNSKTSTIKQDMHLGRIFMEGKFG